MSHCLKTLSSVLVILIFGSLLGIYGYYTITKIHQLEVDHITLTNNVEQFAKQVNDEFIKIRTEIHKPVPDKEKK